jgi:hypothetical protein
VQATLKAHFHDLEIQLEQRQLALERDLTFVGLVQRVPQQLAEARDHLTHAARGLAPRGSKRRSAC